MRKYSGAVVLVFLFNLFILSSCADMFFNELKIESIGYDSQSVNLRFNQAVDEQSLLKAFKLTRDKEGEVCILKKEEGCYKFFVDGGLKQNYDYVVTIDTNLEDADGISLRKTFIYEFSTRKESIAPFIKTVFPNDGNKVEQPLSQILIEFSEPIETTTFNEAFSISPSCEYCLEFEDEAKRAKLVLTEELKENTKYLISISTDLEDLCRNNLKNEFNSYFVYKEHTQIPEYKVFLVNGEDKKLVENESEEKFLTGNSKLRIEFTKQMDFSGFAGFVTFVPSVTYKSEIDYVSEKAITLSFNDIDWDDRHVFWLRSGISDLAKLKTQKEFRCNLVFNSQNFMNVSFVNGFLEVNRWTSSEHDESEVFVFNKQNNFDYLVFNVKTFKKDEEEDAVLYLVFDTSQASDGIDEFSVMENFSTSVTNRALELTLKNISKVKKEDYALEYIDKLLTDYCTDTYFNLSVIKVCLKVKNTDLNGVVTFSLDKSISDSLGNTLKEDCVFKFNK